MEQKDKDSQAKANLKFSYLGYAIDACASNESDDYDQSQGGVSTVDTSIGFHHQGSILVPACVCGEILANHKGGIACGDQPEPQEWVNGLLEVGNCFEYRFKNQDLLWIKGMIVYSNQTSCVIRHADDSEAWIQHKYLEFRPAQLEVEERELFAKTFCQEMSDAGSIPSDFDDSFALGRALYDAGYRLTKGSE